MPISPSTQLAFNNYEFTFYEWSGGLVVTRGGVVVDAGIVGVPGPISKQRLDNLAHRWVWSYHDYLKQRAYKDLQIEARHNTEVLQDL